MIVFEVAFLLVNLAVPYWIWTSKSTSTLPKVAHESIKKTVHELSEAAGGFAPCDSTDVADLIDDLCEKSREKWTEKESVAFERAAANVVFSCEVKKGEVNVQWLPNSDGDHDLNCIADREQLMAYGPTFVLNLKGQMRRIEYSTPEGGRAATPMLNCRQKLKRARGFTRIPASTDAFLDALGNIPNDPPDYLTGNLICLGFDPHPGWDPWRRKFGL